MDNAIECVKNLQKQEKRQIDVLIHRQHQFLIVQIMNPVEEELEFEDNAAVCVVLASDGYPVKYEKGFKIHGLEKFKDTDGYYVFHAGTKFDEDGDIVTNGGRVLGVTAKGKDLKEARANAYKATEWINFANKYMRHDIGHAIDEA